MNLKTKEDFSHPEKIKQRQQLRLKCPPTRCESGSSKQHLPSPRAQRQESFLVFCKANNQAHQQHTKMLRENLMELGLAVYKSARVISVDPCHRNQTTHSRRSGVPVSAAVTFAPWYPGQCYEPIPLLGMTGMCQRALDSHDKDVGIFPQSQKQQ